jgi:hypothetical protein
MVMDEVVHFVRTEYARTKERWISAAARLFPLHGSSRSTLTDLGVLEAGGRLGRRPEHLTDKKAYCASRSEVRE